ncbi:MAG TPA: TolC family protein [Chitinophagaceae bacterium]|nr:TolC family protein [Chitinophagaceae bacterium]
MVRKSLLAVVGCLFYITSFCQQRKIDYFVDTALTINPQLYANKNLILSNSIDSQVIVAANKIQVNGISNSYYAPVVNGIGYDAAITNGQQLQAMVAVTKQIYNKRNLEVQYEGLRLQNDSLQIASAITAQDIKKAVTGQYILTYGDQLQIGFTDKLITLLSHEEGILKTLTRQNVYKQADYLSFLVTLQQQQLIRSQLLLQYKNDYATLNYLAGITDTTTTSTLLDPQLHYTGGFGYDTSVFLKQFTVDSLQLRNLRTGVDVSYRPKVSLYGDGGYLSSLVLKPYKNFGTSFGVNLTIPIYDGHQRQLQYTKIDIMERTRVRQRDYFRQQLAQQVEQLQQQLRELEKLKDPIDRQIEYLKTLINVNGKLLETGDIKIADYVLALNNYITSQNLVVQNLVARYQVINQLNYWNASGY